MKNYYIIAALFIAAVTLASVPTVRADEHPPECEPEVRLYGSVTARVYCDPPGGYCGIQWVEGTLITIDQIHVRCLSVQAILDIVGDWPWWVVHDVVCIVGGPDCYIGPGEPGDCGVTSSSSGGRPHINVNTSCTPSSLLRLEAV